MHAQHSPALVRAIGRWSLVALVINSVIGSAIFVLPGVIPAKLGAQSVWAYLVAALGNAVIMACYAEVASRFSEAGGTYLYSRVALGRFVGIQIGWLSWLVRISAAAANANLFVISLAEFWPQAQTPDIRLAVLTLLLGALAFVNILGVRSGTNLSNVFTIGKLLPLTIFIAAGVLYLASEGRAASAPDVSPNAGDWLEAVLLLAFAYGGYDAAMMPMAEARNPRRDAAFALFVGIFVLTAIYTLIQAVVLYTIPTTSNVDRPLAMAARLFFGPAGAVLMITGALISVYGYLSAQVLNTPRLTFALAERGDFPGFFAAVHTRFRTPYVSIIGFTFLVWLLAVNADLLANITLSAVARLFTYGAVGLALIVLRRQEPEGALIRLPFGNAFGAVCLGFSILLITRIRHPEFVMLAITAAVATLNWLWARKHAEKGIYLCSCGS